MLRKAAIIALAFGLAAPATASEQIVREIKVDPGAYSLHEIVQISTSGGPERGTRIKLIQKEREAFAEAVRQAMHGGGVLSTSGGATAR